MWPGYCLQHLLQGAQMATDILALCPALLGEADADDV